MAKGGWLQQHFKCKIKWRSICVATTATVDVPDMICEPCMLIVAETATNRYLKDNIAVTRQHNLVLSDDKYL